MLFWSSTNVDFIRVLLCVMGHHLISQWSRRCLVLQGKHMGIKTVSFWWFHSNYFDSFSGVEGKDTVEVEPSFLNPYTDRMVHFVICPSHQVSWQSVFLHSVANKSTHVVDNSSRTWYQHSTSHVPEHLAVLGNSRNVAYHLAGSHWKIYIPGNCNACKLVS